MSFTQDLTACAAIVEKGDPVRFAAAMAAPVAARRVLFPLYAFNVEVARAPWVTQETMIAEMRLQWWRDALEEIARGQTVRRHEVVTPLAEILPETEAGMLDRLVAARRWDIYRDAFEDASAFERYFDDTAGALMLVAARCLAGEALAAAEVPLRGFGRASGLARFLQAVPELEARNRVPLLDGRAAAVEHLARTALQACPSPKELRRLLPGMAKSAATEGFLTKTLLKQVVADPRCVAEGRLDVNPMKRSLLLLRWS